MTSAADRYAATYDAALQAGRLFDHNRPGDRWAELAAEFRMDPRRALDGNLSALAEYLNSTDTLVDVGAGAGRVSLAMASRVAEVVAVEPSAGMREQFVASRDEAGIANARVVADWWMDCAETGDIVHLADVTYFVREIVPFITKLHNSASRRVMITVWNPTPGDVDLFPRRLLFGEATPKWPGMPELVAVLWEMGLLPHVRPLPDHPWWLPEAAGGLSDEDAVQLTMRMLESEDDPLRERVASNMDDLFERDADGLTPRWLNPMREVLITWETGGRRLA